ncbi:hypothetical protein EW146_g7566 [Bondarzewia mesenterica]|uniref:Uncharacterized protein n=1 Tax=Bondarzewia mesenterica TaxID=1095465 RepID=A0A4S4LKZ2_9AGAM|nr:hypothetical protein EW146_g7566 [Bondarzewia mesenterica]
MRHLSYLIFIKTTPSATCIDVEATATVVLPNKCVQLEDIAIVLTILLTVRSMHGDVDAVSLTPPAILLMANMAASTILPMVGGAHSDVDATTPAPPAVSLMAGVAGTSLLFLDEVREDGKVQLRSSAGIMMLGKATGEPPFSPLANAMTVHANASTIPLAALQPAPEHPSEAQEASYKCKVSKAECLKDLQTARQKDNFVPWISSAPRLYSHLPIPSNPLTTRIVASQEGLHPLSIHAASATISSLTQDGPSTTTTGDGRDPAQCSIAHAMPSTTMPDAWVSAEMPHDPSTGLDPSPLLMHVLTLSNGNIICYTEHDVPDPPAASYAVNID